MLQNNGRRSKIEIINSILSLLRLGDTGSTEITSVVKINHEQTSRYLTSLFEAGLIVEAKKETEMPIFGITEKGLDLLRQIENMQEMLPPLNAADVLLRVCLIKLVVSDTLNIESSRVKKD